MLMRYRVLLQSVVLGMNRGCSREKIARVGMQSRGGRTTRRDGRDGEGFRVDQRRYLQGIHCDCVGSWLDEC